MNMNIMGFGQISLAVLMIVSFWKLFEKAGEPGWYSLIPLFNIYIIFKIAGKPLVWFLLGLIPIVNIVVGVLVSVSLARNFGKQDVYAAGLVLLPFIFYPMLAFGDSTYQPILETKVS